MAYPPPSIKQQFFDDNGDPLSGGKLYSYEGGTNIPIATYKDKEATEPNENPIVLNSRGECEIWLPLGLYKFILKDPNDVTIWTQDNVPSLGLALNDEASEAAQEAKDARDAAQGFRDEAETFKNSAQTSATGASTSATNAASSASAASTSATNASNSASAAAGSATSAGTSATNANTSASNASTSATNAGNSATAAANSATAAHTSELNAAASATAAATYNPMTTVGDMIIGGSSGTPTRLAADTIGKILRSGGPSTAFAWSFDSLVSKTTTYTTTNGDDEVLCSASSAAFTVTLHTASGNSGKIVTIKKTDSSTNVVTISTTSSQTIDGASAYYLTLQNESVTLVSNGSNWIVIAKYTPLTVKSVTSSIKTPTGSGFFHSLSNNSMTLEAGTYEFTYNALFSNNASSVGYANYGVGVFAANGGDNGTAPALISTIGTLNTPVATFAGLGVFEPASGSDGVPTGIPIVVTFTQQRTVYVVTYSSQTTSSNARVTAYMNARKII